MIKNWKNLEAARDSGIVYKSMLKQICVLGEMDPEKAGELAVLLLSQVLEGGLETDDSMMEMYLAPYQPVIERAMARYDSVKSSKKETAAEKYKYRELVKLKKAGLNGEIIAKELGYSNKQKVAYHWKKVCESYRELLQEEWPEASLQGVDRQKNFQTDDLYDGKNWKF